MKIFKILETPQLPQKYIQQDLLFQGIPSKFPAEIIAMRSGNLQLWNVNHCPLCWFLFSDKCHESGQEYKESLCTLLGWKML